MAAWKVFVPIGEEGMLTSAEWQVVLAMLTGGLGMSQSETDQLFQLFDEDGSGTLACPRVARPSAASDARPVDHDILEPCRR